MLNLDPTTLNAVVEQACADAAQHVKWLTAIGRAVVELTSNPYLERQDGHLLIASPSGALYAANGVCQCMAYTYGNPCWHRAAARLVRLCDEREAAQQVVCSQPDNLCEVHNPCPEHAEAAADYLRSAVAPLGERLAKARAQMDEVFG